ncbi:MAG: HD domain-containing protein [Aestuariibacter sp.]|nr:HD domain-containing protein [Aestuariibacter sp.]|tara:strand:+ start:12126 stop:13469 length:1344 start_codon:yes stop_codon:yes gene_type:complete
MEAYLVGGAVRDKLLGLPVSDRDWVVVGATPEQMLEHGFKQVGKDFPVFLHPENGEEFALARTEYKVAAGHKGFKVDFSPDVGLESDLCRRDLTINAMAYDAVNDEVIDPLDAMRDIRDKVLRHTSSAYFDDPLRVLRTARFAARFAHLGFTVADETMNVMTLMAENGDLEHLTPERVWKETQKALATETPTVYFEVLRQCGALAIVLPEIDALFGMPQRADFHPEIDSGIHTLLVLERCCELTSDPVVRFAALCHDLGKARTRPYLYELPEHLQELAQRLRVPTVYTNPMQGHTKHEPRGAYIIKDMAARLRIPNEYRDLAMMTAKHHTQIHTCSAMNDKALLKLLEETKALAKPKRFKQMLLVCEADAQGRPTFERVYYYQADIMAAVHEAATYTVIDDVGSLGLKGIEVGLEIKKRRRVAIKRAQKNWRCALLKTTLLDQNFTR